MSAVNGYNIYNHGVRVYSDTQAQTQPTTAKPTSTQQAAPTKVDASKSAVTPSQAEKVSISDTGRAAVAQNKDSFVNAIMKAGYSKEAAEARFSALQSQRSNDATTPVAARATPSAATSATQPAASTSSTTGTTAVAQPENKDLNRFITGFTKSGHTKEQAIAAYNTYAAIASQQGIHT